ncbi:acyl-CoA thioesterase [Glaciecola sp. 1036]|uniref:acyl-CoA thioesterase n=1 Tax=Alteromonadaceae TaxID=72275 RepID=UPI003D0122F0
MANVKLSSLFDLESLEHNLYRGNSWDLGFRALYGGQVLGQSVMAAYQTVPDDRVIHSFHSYFLLPGDAGKSVVYDVENVRDGRSFSARRIRAIQNGRTIFYMTASFQKPEESKLTHQFALMPEVPPPEEVSQDLIEYEKQSTKISERVRKALEYHKPVDIRTIGENNWFDAQESDPVRKIWLKSRDPLPDSLAINQASLAYASDYHFLSTSLLAHGLATYDKRLRMATIDHAMWFHKPFKFDEWMMYQIESSFSGNGRAIVQGKILDQNGQLVATAVQEGLVRIVE